MTKELGLNSEDIIWSDKVIKFLIEKIKEKGVRKLEQALRTILSKINTAKFLDIKEIKNIKFPLKLDNNLINLLTSDHFSSDSGPPIGLYL